MIKSVEVEGLETVRKRLHVVAGEYATGMERGQCKGGLYLLNKTLPLTPIDTGGLRASGFVEKNGTGFKTQVTVGFTQPYATFVHERMDLHHAAPTQAKFLESASARYRDQIARIIRDEAQRRKGTIPALPGRVLGGFPRDPRLRPKTPGASLSSFAQTLRKELLAKQG